MQIPEPVSGAVYLGRTAANRALVEWGSTVGAVAVSVYRYIPGGTGGGGGTTEARVQQLINATSLSALQGQVADTQIPAAIMRDAEFTAAAVRSLLGLTAQEVNDLLTGATISGQVITIVQNDGSTLTLTIPAGGGMSDGVVQSGAIVGTGLVLTLDTGVEVTIDIDALATDMELAAYAALGGATFTGAVSGPTPTTDANLATKLYVDEVAAGMTPTPR